MNETEFPLFDGGVATAPPDFTPEVNIVPDPSGADCWRNISEIYYDLADKLPFSQNTYVICPGEYDIGYSYGRGLCCENGYLPLVVRANTHYLCGEDGSSENGCIFTAGTSHVLINEAIFNEEITGAIVEGALNNMRIPPPCSISPFLQVPLRLTPSLSSPLFICQASRSAPRRAQRVSLEHLAMLGS